MGTVLLNITDDNKAIFTIKLETSLYFPGSSVNIASISYLVDTYEDDHEKYMNTSRFSSKFIWGFKKYVKTMFHADSRIKCETVNYGVGTIRYFS